MKADNSMMDDIKNYGFLENKGRFKLVTKPEIKSQLKLDQM
jgi:hypothetical protein